MAEPQQDRDILAELQRSIETEPLLFDTAIFIAEEVVDLSIQIAVVWTTSLDTIVRSSANGTLTPGGGMHLEGFKKALTQTVNNYGRTHERPMGCFEDLLGEDIRVALNAVLRINCREPEFEWNHGEGETGQKLASRQARAFAEWATSTHLSAWLDQHPIAAMKLLEQSAVAASARVGRRAEWDLWRSLGI